MLKKTSILSAYAGLQCCNLCASQPTSAATSKTSPVAATSPRTIPSTRPRSWTAQRRNYATTRDTRGPDFRDNMNWPCRNATPTTPTPYEIFDLEKSGTYTKHKYYQLVKLYHPDKYAYHSEGQELTHAERLERYRLVVLAHEILSDPVKRKAYDAYGAGWGEGRHATRHSRGFTSGSTGRQYGFGPGEDASPFANATWEDWERWYRRRDEAEKQTYEGIYMNPNAFASFVILMAVLAGVVQATRAGQYSSALTDKAQQFTEETASFMQARAKDLSENGLNHDGRVKAFLSKRDPTRYGLKDDEEGLYRKHFAGDQHMLNENENDNNNRGKHDGG